MPLVVFPQFLHGQNYGCCRVNSFICIPQRRGILSLQREVDRSYYFQSSLVMSDVLSVSAAGLVVSQRNKWDAHCIGCH